MLLCSSTRVRRERTRNTSKDQSKLDFLSVSIARALQCVCDIVGTMPIEDAEKFVRKEPLEQFYDVGHELGR